MKFTLEIKLGNDAMQNYSQVLSAIQRSFDSVIAFEDTNDTNVYEDETGLIRDENGNSVGKWEARD